MRCRAVQSGPEGPLAIAPRGRAARVSVSPAATPILLSPKSSARTVEIIDPELGSGMTGERGELAGFHAEQPERGEPALLVGQVEDHALIRGHRQPGVVEHFLFELPGFPSGITERDEGLFRA